MIIVRKNEATLARRRVYFHLVGVTDGMTPATAEAAGQPQISVDGAAWTDTGIGTLVAIGNGRYYAELTQAIINVDDAVIETRYKSANTAECPGSTVQVLAEVATIAAILTDTAEIGAAGAGLTAVPWNAAWDAEVQSEAADAITAAGLATAAALSTVAAYLDTEVAAILAIAQKLDTAFELDGAVYRFTANALELAPTGGSAPTAADIWAYATRTLSDKTGFALTAAYDPAKTTAQAGDAMTLAANAVSAAAVAADAVTEIQSGLATAAAQATIAGYIDTEVAAVLAAVDTEVAALISTLGTPAGVSVSADLADIEGKVDDLEGRLTALRAAALDNLDAAISTRLAASSYTAPDNTNIGLAKTAAEAVNARLPTDPADQSLVEAAISTRLATAGYTAPDNATIAAIKAKTDLIPAAPANEVTLALVEDILRNKQIVTDNGDGTKTVRVYDDAGTSVLLTWVWTEATGTRARGV